ncbi:hypothetical protein [Mycolicibacterium nivoides]|uniref:Uncharacterized protein n=1 Tax=Mycolicibacterium nivoides TaxID=2487344 RepID=A0ABW9LM27_9MYCO
MTSHTLKVGDLFTHTADITTRPCDRTMHFEAAATGAKTTWPQCYTLVRGRRKDIGTNAELAA